MSTKTQDEAQKIQEIVNGKDDDKTLVVVLKRLKDMQSFQEKYHDEWDWADSVMEGDFMIDKTKEGIRISLSRMIIEHAVAEEINAFSDIEFIAQEPEDRHKEVMFNAAKDSVLEETLWDNERIKGFYTRRQYGIAPFKVSYVQTTREIQQRTSIGSIDDVTYEAIIDHPIDGIRIECITDPRRFFIDPRAYDIHTADDCSLLTIMSADSFLEKYGSDSRYKNVDKVGSTVVNSNTFDTIILNKENQSIEGSPEVKVYEYWNKTWCKYITVAIGATTRIIRNGPMVDDSNLLPFAVAHMYRRRNSFYSMGVPKVLESIEVPYNALIQAELRATKLAFPVITTRAGEMFDTTGLEAYPGLVLPGAQDIVSLQPLGSVPSEVYALKQELIKQAIVATGVNFENVYDTKSDRVGIEALKKESTLALINSNIRMNESVFLVTLGTLLERSIQQYFPVPKIITLLGTEDSKEIQEADKQVYNDKPVYLKYRKIKIDNLRLKEDYDGSKFTLSNNEVDGRNYFLARPEYIRTKSPLHTKVVRPAAMGGSKEAKKITAQEFLSTASDINAMQMQYQKEPVFDIASIGKYIAELNDLPIDKVMAQKEVQGSASARIDKIASPLEKLFASQQSFPTQNNAEVPTQNQMAQEAPVSTV